MARLTGVILVVAGAAAYAFYGLSVLNKRLEVLRGLIGAMLYTASGIGCTQLPLYEIFSSLEKNDASGVFSHFCEGMKNRRQGEELWKECLRQTVLNEEEQTVFIPLGACLGMADSIVQLKTIDMITQNARICEDKLIKQIEKYKAADMKIRIMAGIMTAILLV